MKGLLVKDLQLMKNQGKGLIAILPGSCNFMLVMAALVVGAAWGALYRFFPNRFAAIILSHAVWDVAVFIFFPI